MARVCLVCLILAEILLIQVMSSNSELNPSEIDQVQDGAASHGIVAARILSDRMVHIAPESSKANEGSQEAEPPEIRRLGKHKTDKSVAGGGVIIGGLVTAIFAAVFCYIRVTRKRGGVQNLAP